MKYIGKPPLCIQKHFAAQVQKNEVKPKKPVKNTDNNSERDFMIKTISKDLTGLKIIKS